MRVGNAITTSRIEGLGPDIRSLLLRSFVVPGLTYPIWPFVTPIEAIDPPGVWIAIGACFLAVPLVHLWRPMERTVLQTLMSSLAAAVTLHLFVLASINGMHPFYSVGSSIAVLATALFIRSIRLMIVYSVFVTVLGTALFIAEPDELKLAYWAGMLPLLFLAYHRLTIQLAQRRELEEQVRVRTQQLQEANQLLVSEIDERGKLEDELRVTHKMEAVGRLAGGVAHDFNNLLTTIGVYAELVLGGLSENSPLRNEVEQIQKANLQAASLTQQLLTLGRRSHVQIDFIDLNTVVADAGSMLRHLLSSDTKLELLGTDPQPIWGNIDQLQQILINLAINARDAMTNPGVFSIETSRCAARDLVEREVPGTPTSDDYVVLTVSDSGSGMDAEARARAFDPFFTTKEPDQGAGLGLSIVHGIVSQADGHVRLQSEPGEGTRFELYWPLAISETENPSPTSDAFVGVRGEAILLVEDEKDLRDALYRVLGNAGYSVTRAENGRQALEIATDREHGFDLLITDVVMPHMNGFELAERITHEHPGTRVLLVSGHLNDGALDHLPNDMPFLAKPFAATELSEKVRELLDERV